MGERLDRIKKRYQYSAEENLMAGQLFSDLEWLIARVEKLEDLLEEVSRPPKMSETSGTLMARLSAVREVLAEDSTLNEF